MRDKIKRCHICAIGVPKAEADHIGAERTFIEIMPEKFPDLVKDKFIDTRNSTNSKEQTLKKKINNPRHITIKLLKTIDKEKVLKVITGG